MGFFKKIGRALKKGVEAVGDIGDKIVDGVGEAAGWVTDKVGDGIEGITRVVAGDKAADAVKKTFDNKIEAGIKRGVEGFARIIATPITALDDIAQKGLIDGVIHNYAEGTQDIIGGVTRTIGGKTAETKFDTFYDKKIQPWAEVAAGIVGRIALAVVPGGALLLTADAVSEVGSLAYRAAIGDKIGTAEYVSAALGFALSGVGAATKTASTATKTASTAIKTAGTATKTASTAIKTAGTATKTAGTATKTASTAIKTAGTATKTASTATKTAVTATTAIATSVTTRTATGAATGATTGATTAKAVKDVATDTIVEAAEDQTTSAIAKKIDKKISNTASDYPDTNTLAFEHGGYAQPVLNSLSTSFLPTA